MAGCKSARARRYGALTPEAQRDACALLDEMRLVKDAHELALMRRAGAISAGGHVRAMQRSARMLRAGEDVREYHLEAELLHEFRQHGSGLRPTPASWLLAPTPACCITAPAMRPSGTASWC
jgi:Xaa-Pro aminopeptidase